MVNNYNYIFINNFNKCHNLNFYWHGLRSQFWGTKLYIIKYYVLAKFPGNQTRIFTEETQALSLDNMCMVEGSWTSTY